MHVLEIILTVASILISMAGIGVMFYCVGYSKGSLDEMERRINK